MFIQYNSQSNEYLDITMGLKWDYVSLTKAYIERYLVNIEVGNEYISKISMTASELLENAVKFANKKGVRFILDKFESPKRVLIIVYNYTEKEKADKLFNVIEQIRTQDPLQYYIKKMKESVDLSEGESGLGLPRINYEGQANIDVKYFDEHGILEIKVTFDIS